MKKKTINAFTLVEMLIVIVIIGILIAALMPRMQAAQGRARDVSRKTALSQVQTAIVTYQGDHGEWPAVESGKNGIGIDEISTQIKAAGMNSVPEDPIKGTVSGLGSGTINKGQYGYLVAKRNGVDAGGFVLMAKTEVEGGSNWVVCSESNSETNVDSAINSGWILSGYDITKITLCENFVHHESGSSGCKANTGTCEYEKESQLRYITIY